MMTECNLEQLEPVRATAIDDVAEMIARAGYFYFVGFIPTPLRLVGHGTPWPVCPDAPYHPRADQAQPGLGRLGLGVPQINLTKQNFAIRVARSRGYWRPE